MTQSDLFTPVVADAEVGELVEYLLNRPGFHTAGELSKSFNCPDRKIRKLAEASDGYVVSGPGSPGYCHIAHCDAERIAHIANTLQSQARSMMARSIKLRNRAHALIG